VNIGSDCIHIITVGEVFGVSGSIVADVLRCSAAQERVLDAGGLRSVEVDEAFVNAFFLKKV
jgi:hypothetical protein